MSKRKSHPRFRRLTIGLALAVIGLVAALYAYAAAGGQLGASGKIRIVAAENFWGNIASQIGGSHVAVISIISDPSADPHLYESDARDAGALASADIAIENGLGYDDFFDKLLAASHNTNRSVLSAQTLLGVTDDQANPHLWYDPQNAQAVATHIEALLVQKDPANQAAYAQNLSTFTASLQPITALADRIKAQYPGAPVAYTERVPGYLLDRAGLSNKTPAGFASAIEDGNNPSPADAAAMDRLITSHAVKVLLYNAQATSPVTQHVRDLAKQAGVSVVGVTETLPKGERDYQTWQLDQLTAILKALQPS